MGRLDRQDRLHIHDITRRQQRRLAEVGGVGIERIEGAELIVARIFIAAGNIRFQAEPR